MNMDAGILVSIFLTGMLVCVSIRVIEVFHHSIFEPTKHYTHWLLLGITISFAGAIGDNIWWGVAWGLKYLDLGSHHWWFDNGIYSNIFCRQGSKVVAGYCHLKAAQAHGIIPTFELRAFMSIAAAIGILCVMFLFFIKQSQGV